VVEGPRNHQEGRQNVLGIAFAKLFDEEIVQEVARFETKVRCDLSDNEEEVWFGGFC
jgi:hypothetical protein